MLRTLSIVVVVSIGLLALGAPGPFERAVQAQEIDALRLPPFAYPDAIRLWREGLPEAALADLETRLDRQESDVPLDALVLRARLLEAADRGEESERDWREGLTREPWIRTYARRALVELLATRGQPGDAAEVLQTLTATDAQRHRDLVLSVADAYLNAGLSTDAARVYRQLITQRRRGPLSDAARLGLAKALEAEGELRTALSVLRETRLLHSRADIYREATKHERRLARQLDLATRPFDESEYRTLTRRLRNASRFALARSVLDEWQRAHPLTARPDQIAAERIETLYAERSNEAAVAAAQQFYTQYPVSGLVPHVRLTEFRLAVRMTDTERARAMGLDLWRGRVPGATAEQRRDAAVLLAAYLSAVGDVEGGLELYRELFQTSHNADDQRAYLWRAGVAALRVGQDERALTNLRGLVGRNPTGDLAPASLYWLGAAEQRGDPDRAAQTFRTVHQRFPYHYYGIRARERLQQLGQADPPSPDHGGIEFPRLTLSDGVETRAEYKAAMVLARAGLVGDAAWYLRRLLGQKAGGSALALLAARASGEAGEYAAVSRIMASHFGRFLNQPARGLPDDFWNLAYPRPFWNEIQAAAYQTGVDPVLMVSLMRQESRFDPAARSPVGAVGLFQIMPYTARALGRAAGLGGVFESGVNEATLMEPGVNARIAARLTANLLQQFDGDVAPVIASYNAGEERVTLWWSASSTLGEDVFVDSIPYSETRRFVREVLTNYAAYRRVYEE